MQGRRWWPASDRTPRGAGWLLDEQMGIDRLLSSVCGGTVDAMASPLARVHVDRQGRLVLPQRIREELVEVPGDVILERTVDGVLLRPVHGSTSVRDGEDGLPILEVGRFVGNDEVVAAIDRERAGR